MIDLVGWVRRQLPVSHEPKPRNVLVTYNGNKVRWRTEKEAQNMIEQRIVNFVTPQRGKTKHFEESFPTDETPTLDE